MRVAICHLDRLVSEQVTDREWIHARILQPRGERMAQRVQRHILKPNPFGES